MPSAMVPAQLDPTMPAIDLARHVRDQLVARGWSVTLAAFGHHPDGAPALLAIRRGRMLTLVCIPTTGQASPAEAGWIGQLRRVPGITAEVLRPVDVAGLLSGLDRDARTPTAPVLHFD
jgi:hypothetical protein